MGIIIGGKMESEGKDYLFFHLTLYMLSQIRLTIFTIKSITMCNTSPVVGCGSELTSYIGGYDNGRLDQLVKNCSSSIVELEQYFKERIKDIMKRDYPEFPEFSDISSEFDIMKNMMQNFLKEEAVE